MKTYKDLIVWQKSMQLVTDVYKTTKTYPKDELFGLVSQMRKSAVSIPSNIAEGHGRRSIKVLIHFLSISLGSSLELETQIIISKNLDYIIDTDFNRLQALNEEVIKMLNGLIQNKENELLNNKNQPE